VTYKTVDNDIIVEDIKTGDRETLASSSTVYEGPRTPRYSFSPKGIDFGNRAIERGAGAELLVIDEIGQLELRQEGLTRALDLVRAERPCVLVIRRELLDAYLPLLPAEPLVFETTASNRDRLPEEIASALLRGNNAQG